MMTKHDAIKVFFEEKVQELAGDFLHFNFSPESPGSIAFITNYSDKVRKKYIRIGAEKEYAFTILLTEPYSADGDDINLRAMNFAQAFMDWLDAQDKAGNYPEFPENCKIKKMENLQNMPNLSGVDTQAWVARYMLQGRIIYFEEDGA